MTSHKQHSLAQQTVNNTLKMAYGGGVRVRMNYTGVCTYFLMKSTNNNMNAMY